MSLTKEVCGHEEEAEGRDRAAAERELDRSPPELLSEGSVSGLGVAVLSSAASFCCGGQETTGRVMQQTEVQGKLNVKSQSTGRNDRYYY